MTDVVGKVNPALRFVLLRVFGPRYRTACATRWGADVAVGPDLGAAPGTQQTIGTSRRSWRTGGEMSLHIEASADRLYDLVADVGTAPARSHEVRSCQWLEGAQPGTVGSRFRGRNQAGLIRWSRVCEVVTAKRGEAFAFRTVPERFDPTRRDSSVWGYRFEPDATGTRITHYYNLVQPPKPWLLSVYGVLMPQHRDARPALKHTLDQLNAAQQKRQ